MYLRLAQKLGRLGYASLRIDFAGSGDSTLPQTAFTYSEEVSDAKTALTWLSHNWQVDPDALGLVGFSRAAELPRPSLAPTRASRRSRPGRPGSKTARPPT